MGGKDGERGEVTVCPCGVFCRRMAITDNYNNNQPKADTVSEISTDLLHICLYIRVRRVTSAPAASSGTSRSPPPAAPAQPKGSPSHAGKTASAPTTVQTPDNRSAGATGAGAPTGTGKLTGAATVTGAGKRKQEQAPKTTSKTKSMGRAGAGVEATPAKQQRKSGGTVGPATGAKQAVADAPPVARMQGPTAASVLGLGISAGGLPLSSLSSSSAFALSNSISSLACAALKPVATLATSTKTMGDVQSVSLPLP